jgi:hypothetical protein
VCAQEVVIKKVMRMMEARGQMIWRKQHNPYRPLCANTCLL